MDIGNKKCVIVVDEELSIGAAANTAAVLGITLGKRLPETVGSDTADADGNIHMGITQLPVPILMGSRELLKTLREKLFAPEFSEITAVDFSETAKCCRTYDEYIGKAAALHGNETDYIGIALCGDRKKIGSLTGNLPLLK